MSEEEGPEEEGPEEGSREPTRRRRMSLPPGWMGWLAEHFRRLVRISEEIGELTKENQMLRQRLQELAESVNHQAGQLEQIDKTIEARVELEVRKRLDEQRRSN